MILLFLSVCVVLVEVSRSVALTDEGKASLQAYLQNEALLLAEAQAAYLAARGRRATPQTSADAPRRDSPRQRVN